MISQFFMARDRRFSESQRIDVTRKVFCRTCGRLLVAQLNLQLGQVFEVSAEELNRDCVAGSEFQGGPLMNDGLLQELASLREPARIHENLGQIAQERAGLCRTSKSSGRSAASAFWISTARRPACSASGSFLALSQSTSQTGLTSPPGSSGAGARWGHRSLACCRPLTSDDIRPRPPRAVPALPTLGQVEGGSPQQFPHQRRTLGGDAFLDFQSATVRCYCLVETPHSI